MKRFGDYILKLERFDGGTPPPNPKRANFSVRAYLGAKEVGSLLVTHESGKITADMDVLRGHQRQGLMTAMYDWAEELAGKLGVPSSDFSDETFEDKLSGDAQKFWESRWKKKAAHGKEGQMEIENHKIFEAIGASLRKAGYGSQVYKDSIVVDGESFKAKLWLADIIEGGHGEVSVFLESGHELMELAGSKEMLLVMVSVKNGKYTADTGDLVEVLNKFKHKLLVEQKKHLKLVPAKVAAKYAVVEKKR